jgi:hypothetical protein
MIPEKALETLTIRDKALAKNTPRTGGTMGWDSEAVVGR